MRPDGPRDPIAGPDTGPEPPFPIRLDGEVIKGFGRGSKELGIPTANLPISGLAVGGHDDLQSGVYYGWASLSSYTSAADQSKSHSLPATGADTPQQTSLSQTPAGESPAEQSAGVFPMVMSIGWNPYYKNEKRSVEVHIMHAFAKDFYGKRMKVLILGFIRPEYDYTSLESLVEDIRTDIDVSLRSLEREPYRERRGEGWLVEF
ncbi:riboflavin kinase-domain-containing protein [Elsinoe ampelina]|uniref:Riboflavin kinase n=1 Tax=Elsinoe ampelina TaxID=302913 RepID=A0A6A6GD72_9PEZI|nr:riboflavin kinase-domain-containing protein [Elsinoe ampelina]